MCLLPRPDQKGNKEQHTEDAAQIHV
jgi:hypothetical protein